MKGEAVVMSARTKCTSEVVKLIVTYVQAGATIKEACGAAGVPWSTASDWARRGRDGEEPYATFVAETQRAKYQYRIACLSIVTSEIKRNRNWRAALAMYDRRSARQKTADGSLPPPPGDEAAERVVLLYPVPMPSGADEQTRPPTLPSAYRYEEHSAQASRASEDVVEVVWDTEED